MNRTYTTEAASAVGSELWVSIARAAARGGRRPSWLTPVAAGSHSRAEGARGDRCAVSASSAPSSGKSKSLLIRPRRFLCVSSPKDPALPPVVSACSETRFLQTGLRRPPCRAPTEERGNHGSGGVREGARAAGYCLARKGLGRARRPAQISAARRSLPR